MKKFQIFRNQASQLPNNSWVKKKLQEKIENISSQIIMKTKPIKICGMRQSRDGRKFIVLNTSLEKKCHFKISDLNFYFKSLEKKSKVNPKQSEERK